MYTKKFSTALVFFSIASFSPAYGMETLDDADDYKWIPIRLTSGEKDNVIKLVEGERRIAIQTNPGDWTSDYGFSFPQVNHVQKLCLENIYELYSQQKERPTALDLGAGHGLMTWKMLVAGAHVTAIEGQKPTALMLQQKVRQAKPFLDSKETVKSVCKTLLGNVCDYNLNIYKTPYKVTWSGNIIHLFTPTEATAYVNNLYKITESGGYAFASVHSASKTPFMLRYFNQRKKAKEPFPGFFIVNKIHSYVYDNNTRSDRCVQVKLYEPCHIAPSDMSPIKVVDGFYQSSKAIKFDYNEVTKTYKIRCHTAMHIFDPESLSDLFKRAGFDIEGAFFMDENGKRVDKELSFVEICRNHLNVGIVARKPVSTEEKK